MYKECEMSDPAPLAYGRDVNGRFTAGNTVAKGRAHAFARKAAALRQAFYAEVKPADMRRVVRTLITEATGGNLQAARLLLLWVIGKPDDAVHPDGIARLIAAEAQAATPPSPMPADREACLDLAARELAAEIRACRGLIPAPSEAVETTLEQTWP
jgi:hypothetical protein